MNVIFGIEYILFHFTYFFNYPSFSESRRAFFDVFNVGNAVKNVWTKHAEELEISSSSGKLETTPFTDQYILS